jgi:hypothetical protein
VTRNILGVLAVYNEGMRTLAGSPLLVPWKNSSSGYVLIGTKISTIGTKISLPLATS